MRKHLIAVLTASALGALLAPGVARGQAPSVAGDAPDSNAVMKWNANAGDAATAAARNAETTDKPADKKPRVRAQGTAPKPAASPGSGKRPTANRNG